MLLLSKALKLYKRRDIQEEIVANAQDREVAIKFGDKGFGKRPDTLTYPNDVLELAKQGATSFHASEERWVNPLQIDTGLRYKELNEIRSGWDLVLDIDFPVWKLSRIIAWLIIKSLREHGVKSITIKFSGNKGFHIGVPFESFPKEIANIDTKEKFPDAPRKIALYLLDYIGRNHIEFESDIIKFGGKYKLRMEKLKEMTGKDRDSFSYWYCKKCNKRFDKIDEEKQEIVVSGDDVHFLNESNYSKKISKRKSFTKKACDCANPEYVNVFDPTTVIDIDTILISVRHLYRMPYSLHEKSQLVSIPFDPDKVLEFEKSQAEPDKVEVSEFRFLDRRDVQEGEARRLLIQALDARSEEEKREPVELKEIEIPEQAIPEQFFPPCMMNGLAGLKDGRKRFLFSLRNFLTCVGWNYDQIEEVANKWNEKNFEPLRETIIRGQLRYHKQSQKKMLPPNCQNLGYYLDIGICKPDNLCKMIKNPVQYSKRKTRYMNAPKKKTSKKPNVPSS